MTARVFRRQLCGMQASGGNRPNRLCRVLGIDTSLRSTGLGVVEAAGVSVRPVDFGLVVNRSGLSLSQCLDRLYRGVMEMVERTKPSEVAIEGVFYCRNARTAVTLGEARGAVIACATQAGLPVFEYPPRRIKQAVAGYGAAGKEQICRMITALLGLRRAPPEDAADALAIAICHINAARARLGGPEPI